VEGTEQREAAEAFGRIERELLRDDTAHRVTDDVRRGPSDRVEHRARVVRHLGDGDGPAKLALADASMVEERDAVIASERVELRAPTFAGDAASLDEENRGRSAASRTSPASRLPAGDLVVKRPTATTEVWHRAVA
jgi:hypothetical protein